MPEQYEHDIEVLHNNYFASSSTVSIVDIELINIGYTMGHCISSF